MPIIDLTDDELAAVTAAVRRTLEADKFPHAPRLKPLRSALAKLDPASASRRLPEPKPPLPEAPARSQGGRRARRYAELAAEGAMGRVSRTQRPSVAL
jgi:hypothetical protein